MDAFNQKNLNTLQEVNCVARDAPLGDQLSPPMSFPNYQNRSQGKAAKALCPKGYDDTLRQAQIIASCRKISQAEDDFQTVGGDS